jgi:hypothetical protein
MQTVSITLERVRRGSRNATGTRGCVRCRLPPPPVLPTACARRPCGPLRPRRPPGFARLPTCAERGPAASDRVSDADQPLPLAAPRLVQATGR